MTRTAEPIPDKAVEAMVRAYNRSTDYIFPQATPAEQREAMRAALSAALPHLGAAGVAVPDVDSLAQEIRRVDGNHSLGAGALAEALMPFLSAAIATALAPAASQEGR